MDSHFARVPVADIPRSVFDRSHGHKTTFNAGYLVPIFVDEVLPGDTLNVRASYFARLATPIYPLMDNLYLDVFYFFVPYRLVWDNWQKMMGEQVNPGDSIDYLVPVLDTAPAGTPMAFPVQSIFDYMGLPINSLGLDNVSALPFRAYNLIWNEWFRDQDIQDTQLIKRDDGPDDMRNYLYGWNGTDSVFQLLLRRC